MLRSDRRLLALAVGLSGLAGFVDAIGFLEAGGFFISFMSGNSTRLAVGVAEGTTAALAAVALIIGFVGGCVLGFIVGHLAGTRRRPAVTALVTKAVEGGGSTYKDPQDHGFMYGHGFQDLDGHLWEIIYMESAPPTT